MVPITFPSSRDHFCTYDYTLSPLYFCVCSQVVKSNTNVGELGPLGNMLTRDFGQLASDTRGAVASSQNAEVGGSYCIHLHSNLKKMY